VTGLQQFRALFSICLVGLAVVGLFVAPIAVGATGATPSEQPPVATVTGGDTSGTNETTPHKDPETVSEDGDSDRVAAYLSGRLSGFIGASTQNISAGQYEQARSLLGDEFNETLSQYVAVTGDTDQEASTDQFETAQENAAELAALRAEFDATRQAYETAVENGETERARRLARELATLADQIDGVSVRLTTALNDIENTTSTNLSGTQTTVISVQESTTTTAAAVSETEFTATTLTATLSPSRFSFETPTTVSGTLHTAAGDPIRNQSVTIQVGERTYNTETDRTGQFSLQYRPVFLGMNTTTIPIGFVPADSSPYQSANTTVAGQVTTQTSSTLSLTTTRLSTSPGQPFAVTGTVTIGDNTTIAGVPVVFEQAGQELGTAETTADGRVTLSGTLPLTTARGATDATVRVPLSTGAVSGTVTPVNLTVTEAPTRLTLATNVTGTTAPIVGVSGELTLASGTSLAGESVTILVDDTEVTTTTTGPNGQYSATVPTSALDPTAETSTIRAVFIDSDRALAASRTSTTLQLPAPFTTDSSWPPQLSAKLLIVAAVVVGVVLAGASVARIRGWSRPWQSTGLDNRSSAPSANLSNTGPTAQASTESTTRAHALLDQAEDSLTADETTTAVQVAYASLRSALAPTLSDSRSDTHWEFYNRCRDAGIEPLDETETVTAAYEEATFAPVQISADRAQQVIDAVATVVDQTDTAQSRSGSHDD
jgi:hypothetical protein